MPERNETEITKKDARELYKRIGKNIKTVRKKHLKEQEDPKTGLVKEVPWTQADLAKKSNRTQSYISDIEKGKAHFTVDVLMDLCNALGVTPNVLLGIIESPLTEDMAIALHFMTTEEQNKLLQLYDLMKRK